jgi:hypothetical protein
MKQCSKCKKEKEERHFYKRSNRPSGLTSSCKECVNSYPKNRIKNYMRNYDLKKSYNITVEDYDRMFQSQNGCCAICGKHKSELKMKIKNNLCIDHCHETGIIRGLLCDKCNRGIGLLEDSLKNIKSAVIYLEKSQHAPKAVEGFIHDKLHGQVARLSHLF